jgi:hypothetical protein
MVRYALRALGQYRMDKSGDLAYYEELAKERARAEVLRVKQAEVRNPGLFDTAVFGLEFKAARAPPAFVSPSSAAARAESAFSGGGTTAGTQGEARRYPE